METGFGFPHFHSLVHFPAVLQVPSKTTPGTERQQGMSAESLHQEETPGQQATPALTVAGTIAEDGGLAWPENIEPVATWRRRYARSPSQERLISLTPTNVQMLRYLGELRFLSLVQLAKLCCPSERQDLSEKNAR